MIDLEQLARETAAECSNSAYWDNGVRFDKVAAAEFILSALQRVQEMTRREDIEATKDVIIEWGSRAGDTTSARQVWKALESLLPKPQEQEPPHGHKEERMSNRIGLDAIKVRGVWLRREGEHCVVLVEIGDRWIEVIREHREGNFSHICEPTGIAEAAETLP